jgi:site-specific DNA-methyltransferase (adenine-specific)
VSPRATPEVLLLRDDCRHGLQASVGPRSIDVVVTSPPYNLGIAYGSYDDRRPREEYLGFLGEVRDGLDRVLADEGSIFLNLGATPKDPFLPWDVARRFGERFPLQNVIHWVKSIAIDRASAGRSAGLDRDLALGHYKPSRSDRFLHGAHEYVFHFTRTGNVPIDRLAVGVPYQDKTNVDRWASGRRDLRCRGNTWFLPYGTIQRRATDRPHPASFPPELPEWCYRLHGVDRIHRALDPFVGIGASAVAAVRVGVDFIGFDIDEEYLVVARRRVAEARDVPRSLKGRSGSHGPGPHEDQAVLRGRRRQEP